MPVAGKAEAESGVETVVVAGAGAGAVPEKVVGAGGGAEYLINKIKALSVQALLQNCDLN